MIKTSPVRTGPLNETERWILINALEVAANHYEFVDAADPEIQARTAKTFRDQAASVRKWAELIENADEVIIR